jgi:outer membrane protein
MMMLTMRHGRTLLVAVATAATAGLPPVAVAPARAQQGPATLTLEEAVQLARRHSPTYRAQANDDAVADWDVRAAYGDLLPSVSASGGLNWRAGGTRRIENIDLGLRQPDQMSSNYGLGVGLSLSGATFFGMAQARAQREATHAQIDAAAHVLEVDVTRQYLSAMRARDAVLIAQREFASAEAAYELAQARVAAGAAARVDASQAEVERGRAEVGVLQAESNEQVERLRLLQVIGLDPGQPIQLTSEFDIFEPAWTLEELTDHALARHPQLVAARAGESAGRAGARAARMSYLPSLNISGGWSGYTQTTLDEDFLIGEAQNFAASRIASCQNTNDLYSRLADPLPAQDCSRFAFTDDDRRQLLAANSMFPFDFTKAPPSFNVSLSLPLFNGFQREANMQRASAAAEDARYRRREVELQIRSQLATTYLALQTAYRTVAIEERNVVAAEEQLELQRERYRLGAGAILELTQAQAAKARADQAHLAALYAFHENLAALEAAVGRPLR